MIAGQEKIEQNSNWRERMREARQKLALSQQELGDKWGVAGNYVSMLERGTKPITPRHHAKIFELETEVRKKFEHGIITSHPKTESGGIVLKEEPGTQAEKAPVVSWASAGLGNAFDDLANQIDEWVETDSRDRNKYALIVDGDSMSPDYKPGDRIVVEPNSEARNGDVVVARLRDTGEVFFKLFHEVEKGLVKLSSLNPLFPSIQREKREFRFIHPVYEMKRYTRRKK